jgi:hypothetical protein
LAFRIPPAIWYFLNLGRDTPVSYPLVEAGATDAPVCPYTEGGKLPTPHQLVHCRYIASEKSSGFAHLHHLALELGRQTTITTNSAFRRRHGLSLSTSLPLMSAFIFLDLFTRCMSHPSVLKNARFLGVVELTYQMALIHVGRCTQTKSNRMYRPPCAKRSS